MAAAAAARGAAPDVSNGGQSFVGGPGVSGARCFSVAYALRRRLGGACSEAVRCVLCLLYA